VEDKVEVKKEEKEEEEKEVEGEEETSQVPTKNIKRKGSKASQSKKQIKKIKEEKKTSIIKMMDVVHSKSVIISAKGSRVKRSQNKDAVAKDDTKMAVYVEKADSSSLESSLMKKINAANLKQKLAQTINTSMTIRNNAKHLEAHVSGPF